MANAILEQMIIIINTKIFLDIMKLKNFIHHVDKSQVTNQDDI